MNDYLWDKTGEPDPDVERLEELLGSLRHRHAPLQMPVAPQAAPQRPPLPFRWPYAAAAALALAALAGLWFGLPVGTNRTAERAATATATDDTAAAQTSQAEPPDRRTTNAQVATLAAPPEGEQVVSAAREASDVRARQLSKGARARSAERRQARAARVDGRNLTARADVAARRGEARHAKAAGAQVAVVPTSEQRAAKEQLMFALRLASAKLGDAKRKTSSPPAARPPQGELNKLR